MDKVKADREIRARVLRELEIEGLSRLRVVVLGGRVTLDGTVDSYAKKLTARVAAHRGAGIPELTDNVQVRLPGSPERSDPELAQALARALEFDPFVPERKIHLSVTRGRVILEGEVEMEAEKEDAARAVRHVPGVSGIHNRIRVKAGRHVLASRQPLEGRP